MFMMVLLILQLDKEKELKFQIKKPLYVLKINSENNEIIVGPKENLGKKTYHLKTSTC